jgi:hypothetical protein
MAAHMPAELSVDRIYDRDLKLDTETLKRPADKRRTGMVERQTAAQVDTQSSRCLRPNRDG